MKSVYRFLLLPYNENLVTLQSLDCFNWKCNANNVVSVTSINYLGQHGQQSCLLMYRDISLVFVLFVLVIGLGL